MQKPEGRFTIRIRPTEKSDEFLCAIGPKEHRLFLMGDGILIGENPERGFKVEDSLFWLEFFEGAESIEKDGSFISIEEGSN